MGWFDEQLEYRKRKDDEVFADAVESIAGAVMGKKFKEAFDKQEILESAIEEIIKYYHYKGKNDELPPQIKTIEEQLEYRMRPLGIMRRKVLLDKGWYKRAVGPMMGTLKEDNTAVALLPGKISGYVYLDFKTGKSVKLTRKNEDILAEEAWCFYKPLPLKSLSVVDLLKFMFEQLSASDLLLYIGMMAVSTLVGMLSPMFSKWLFGDVLKSGSLTALYALACFMVCFTFCQFCFSAFQAVIRSRVSTKQSVAVQAAMMSRILSLKTGFFKKYASGELMQRQMYVQSLCSTIFDTIGTSGLTSLFSLVYIGQTVVYAPEMVAPAFGITLLTIAFLFATSFVQIRVSRGKMAISAKTSGISYAIITGIQKIKLAGAEKRMFARWAQNYAKEAALAYNPPTFLKLSTTINLTISLMGNLILYYYAVKSGVSVENYYAFNASYGMVSSAFTTFSGIIITVAGIKPTLEMAKPIMEAEPEIKEEKEIVTHLKGNIEISHVSFRYTNSMPNVLENLSLKIKAGEYLAIVGSTGCGKSTLIRLLLGFEQPQKGAIYFDRKDISKVDLKSLRQNIGTVTQDGKLFMGNIFSNITIAAPQLTLEDAWEAAEIASVADDIRAMPMGMHTLIAEGQGGISGGQKQRLMIARAVVHKPKILIFDEATSALDNITQKKVSEAIDSLKCTRIVIAHRLSTIRHCNRILVLDKGKIIEDGSYDELIAKKGFFAELVAKQQLEQEE